MRAPWLRLGFIEKRPWGGGFDLKGGEREGRSEAAGDGGTVKLSNERYYCATCKERRGI